MSVKNLSSDGIVVGQRVTFVPNADELAPELTPEERSATYLIKRVRGQGDDAFVVLESSDGTPMGWYPVAALAPAPASSETPSPLPEDTVEVPASTALTTPPEGTPQGGLAPRHAPQNFNDGTPVRLSQDDANTKLHLVAVQLMADRPGLSYANAVKDAARMHTEYVLMRDEIESEPEPEPISLSAQMRSAESFIALVAKVKAERGLTSERDAVIAASSLRPDLAIRWREEMQ